ncbi:MarR family winged helix-turn-helix transcriptional regulator [Leucobacter luti]|uniref:DNA-binding MarR family transcriptional regulator n=1 Tax=Leucobacter luti TaxID=340320 RepID=A0A4R6S813_9MICO|nr:MarR family transcriptional regulator [Leucobacter luti]MCW2288944.1 DNA-binding MarR family transcriptional regulator [Leucobacter luti]QYM75170.1 MarR family transcriptional regulator [Leucobacter luti]TCK44906.1 DNA-binding MarR family transcriptional regulator [Leucobacter luti]TDP95427.1 DNA-binding MarR family transcriptional regulator [Leucobacter luti]
MTESPPELTSILGQLRWLGWAQRKAGEDWIRERELSHEQGFALGYLTQQPGTIQAELARVTRTSAASVSSLLQGLERRGLIERRTDPANERRKLVFATAAGSELVAGFDTALEGIEDELLAPLDAAERATLHALLSKVTAELPQPTRD